MDKSSETPEEAASFSATTYERLSTSVSCVLTRFRLGSVLWLLPFYLAFRHVRRESSEIPGLLHAVFLVGGARTCFTLSFWRDERAILEFNTRVRAHVMAANWAFGRTFQPKLNRPEIWSTQWRLWAVSHNLNWEDLDLRQVVADELGCRPEQVASGEHFGKRRQ